MGMSSVLVHSNRSSVLNDCYDVAGVQTVPGGLRYLPCEMCLHGPVDGILIPPSAIVRLHCEAH